jgi:hypothetical protein
MAAQSLVVNEGENGMWLVFWELKEVPEVQSYFPGQDRIAENTKFRCAGNDYRLNLSFEPVRMLLVIEIVSPG